MALAVCAAPFIFYGFVQFSTPAIVGIDGHWQIVMAERLLREGIIYKLPELVFTIYADYFRNHHLFSQALYSPFTVVMPDLILAAKVGAWVFASICALAFLLLLNTRRPGWVLFFLLLFLAGSQGFLERLMMPRVQSQSLIWLLATFYCLNNKLKLPVFILSMTFVWLYDAFFLLLPIAASFIISDYYIHQKYRANNIGLIIAGLLTGIVVNPFFPENIKSMYFNIERSLITTRGVQVGSEWLPYSFSHYIGSNFPILFVLILCLTLLFLYKGKVHLRAERNRPMFAAAVLAALFLLLSIKSRRFIEYMPPFVLLFCMLLLTSYWQHISLAANQFVRWSIVTTVIAACSYNTVEVVNAIQPSESTLCQHKAGMWLKKHLPNGSVLFTTDWDDFPILYHHARQARFIVGLDPLFMQQPYPNKFNTWVEITMGNSETPLSKIIPETFNAHYVFADLDHSSFVRRLESETGVFRVFSAATCRIYKLQPEINSEHFLPDTHPRQ